MTERPTDRLAIAVAQLNPIVGDVAGNLERARRARAAAGRDGADIVAFSELFLAGSPPSRGWGAIPAMAAPPSWSVPLGSRTPSSITPTRCLPGGASRRSASR